MKKIPATPFARLNLKEQQSYLIKYDPEVWPDHLQCAFQIVNKLKPQVAEQIVIDSVGAAHRAVREAYKSQLREGRASIIAALSRICKVLFNATKPKRLREVVRTELDEAARSAFAPGFADLESFQKFFREEAIQRFISKCNTREMLDYALAYEASPVAFRMECENVLARSISRKGRSITAHDVFATLFSASLCCTASARSKRDESLVQEFLAELDGIWTSYGLKVGRGNLAAGLKYRGNLDGDLKYRGPFPKFAERVFLEQRNPVSNLFEPVLNSELKATRDEARKLVSKLKADPDYNEIRKEISAKPFREERLITDRILRRYLDQRDTSKKSG